MGKTYTRNDFLKDPDKITQLITDIHWLSTVRMTFYLWKDNWKKRADKFNQPIKVQFT